MTLMHKITKTGEMIQRQQTCICLTALVEQPDGITSWDSPLTSKRNQCLEKYFLNLSFKFCINQF